MPWFICIGFALLLHNIQTSTSDRLRRLIFEQVDTVRPTLVAALELVRLALADIYTDKFAFLKMCPWSVIGVYYCMQGGCIDAARRRLGECMAEYDRLVAEGKSALLHRVAHRLFAKGGPIRLSFDEFFIAAAALILFPHAFIALQEYAFCMMVCRRIEAVHAYLKRIAATCTWIQVPYLCAKMREARNIKMLENKDFNDYCLRHWNTRNLLNKILQLRFTANVLKGMSVRAKVGAVYQCTLESRFRDMSDARDAQGLWLARTADQRSRPEHLTEWVQLCVQYFKEILDTGDFYSLPTKVFTECLGETPSDIQDRTT